MDDIRTSKRFPVHLPLQVLDDPKHPAGTTDNISAAGVYLWVDGGLEIDSLIEFEITIPGELVGATDPTRLHCHGRVVRCDTGQTPGKTGVACVIERYEFLRSNEAGGR